MPAERWGDPDAIVLRSGRVQLFPARTVTTDVERFTMLLPFRGPS